MITDGALKKPEPEVMFGIHVVSGIPSGSIFYKDEAMLNSADEFRIKLTGQQVHASCHGLVEIQLWHLLPLLIIFKR